jgi:DNA-binding XRE family transcriptional regulator
MLCLFSDLLNNFPNHSLEKPSGEAGIYSIKKLCTNIEIGLTFSAIAVNFVQKCLISRIICMNDLNNVKKIREERLMSKMELARLAGVSVATIDRIERGEMCRMETKRKIIFALGFTLADKDKVFSE